MSIKISGSVLITDDLTEISETEFKYLNAQTTGSAKADAAVILGANKEISGLGDVSAAALSGSGNLSVGGTVQLEHVADTTVQVAADSFYFLDATDGLVKRESMADYAATVAGSGLAAASGVLSVDLNEVPAAAVNVAADSLLILDADDSDATKKESFADLMTAAAGDGLAASAGVLAMDVNELTAFTAVQDSDAIAMSDGTATKKMTRANLLGSALAAFSNGLSSTTIAASSNATVEGIVSGAAGTFDALAGTSLALQGGGITAAGPVAGATNIDGSGDLTMGSISMTNFSVDGSGNAAMASAKVADISDGAIVFGAGGDGELSEDAALGWHAGSSTLLAANVSSSANLMAKGTLSANGETNLYAAANVHGVFAALGNSSLGNANSDVVTVVGQLTSSAGMHISAKSGPYALSIADGVGSAIASEWVTHSDRGLKTNIQEMDNGAALDAVMKLQPSTYEKISTGKSEIGFIAQEVAQVVPEICALDANGEGRGIDYSRMSTLLAGALKAQQEQIAQLKEIVARLQK